MNIYQHRRRYVTAFIVFVFFTITESINHADRDIVTTMLLFFTASFLPVALGHTLDIIAEERHGTK